VTALGDMWREARERSGSDAEALRVVAAQLGESPGETRRILTVIGRVKLGGGGRSGTPKAATPSVARAVPVQLDTAAICGFYRDGRHTGLQHSHALKAVCRRFGVRPPEARRIVADVAAELQGAGPE